MTAPSLAMLSGPGAGGRTVEVITITTTAMMASTARAMPPCRRYLLRRSFFFCASLKALALSRAASRR